MSGPVDVLAVMADAEKCLRRGVVRIQLDERGDEMAEARAAVAELIAAAEKTSLHLFQSRSARDRDAGDDLGAALARCGGAK